jgi:C1A family cysteine protease
VKKTKAGRNLNWRPRLPHHACEKLKLTGDVLPLKVDLRPTDSPIFDQGQEGSCTANAGCGAYDYYRWKAGQQLITSREFVYWVELAFDGNKGQDAGSSLTTCSEVFSQKGTCLDQSWPYGAGEMFQEPPTSCWAEATRYKVKKALQIQQSEQLMKQCLASGNPFIFGISVYESFENAANGVIPMPGPDEQLLGGHALCCVGYDDINQWFIFRNSWGTSWGSDGYGFIPYRYLADQNLASDFWSFQL